MQTKGYEETKSYLRGARIEDHSAIIVPINIPHQHWLVAIIFPRRRCIVFVDSINKPKLAKSYYQHLLQFVQADFMARHPTETFSSSWRGMLIDSPQQPNGFDCGIFTMINVDRILCGRKLDYAGTTATFQAFRRFLLLVCLRADDRPLELPVPALPIAPVLPVAHVGPMPVTQAPVLPVTHVGPIPVTQAVPIPGNI
jgi:Ulp1 family protease